MEIGREGGREGGQAYNRNGYVPKTARFKRHFVVRSGALAR